MGPTNGREQQVGSHIESLLYFDTYGYVRCRVTTLRDLLDRFYLEFFRVSLAAHDANCFGLSLRLESAY